MRYCRAIPAAAWQQLVDGATWPKLTKVFFSGRLGGQLWSSGGAEFCVDLAARSLQFLTFSCRGVPARGAASRLRPGSSPSSGAAPS